MHKEVIEVLIKAGKRELAQAYARQVKAVRRSLCTRK